MRPMRGFLPLLLLFVFVPLAELYLLIEIGSVLGGLTTIALCLFTAALGAWLVRTQGFQTISRAQSNLAEGQIPAVEMFEGLFIVFAGLLLLVPGLVTDMIGFACLIPPLRRLLIKRFMKRGDFASKVASIKVGSPNVGSGHPSSSTSNTIEAEFERIDTSTVNSAKDKGDTSDS